MERTVKQVVFQTPKPIDIKRVAAYARVSSGKDAMLHSLSAQVSYYSGMIQKHPGWMYCGVYADEALTGTKDTRENFQRMLSACRNGELDMIITKSISRFARNTVTLLQSIRELKELGVDVFFEEQNIHTMSADGELMITILASYAQEESRSASENQRWRIQKNFKEGKPWNGTMLGYRMDNGRLIVVPEEAEIVRFIFHEYLSGKGCTTILKELNARGVRSRRGKTFGHTSIQKILRNYCYTGNLLLQQTFRADHLSRVPLPNHGELNQYHVCGAHEAIITPEDYDAVQALITERAEKYSHPHDKSVVYPFTSLIICDHCGKHYRRKVTHGGPVWICPTYNSLGPAACPSKAIPERVLEDIDTSNLSAVRTMDDNTLVLQWSDGSEVVKRWQDRSRSESWTPEMRSAASRRAKERNANHA